MDVSTIDAKIDALAREVHAVHVQVAALAERFPTRDELLEVSRDGRRRSAEIRQVNDRVGENERKLVVLEADSRKIWGAIATVGSLAAGAIIAVLIRAIG